MQPVTNLMSNKIMARPKKENSVIKYVTLRKKPISKGRQSYYLDIYKDGKRHYEFIDLYLVPEIDKAAKIQNENTELSALAIRNQRELEIIQGRGGINSESKGGKMLLIDWLKSFREQKKNAGQSNSNAMQVDKLITRIKAYKGEKTRLKDIDEDYCKGFIRYLSTATSVRHKEYKKPLTGKTAHLYFSILVTALNEAVRAKLITINPATNLSREDKKPIKPEKSQRAYLDISEVKQLIETDCSHPEIKSAFLFACFTGLRLSDITGLTWDNVINHDGQLFISIKMQKTRELLTMKLNKQAQKWMPQQTNKEIFALPNNGVTINRVLKKWAEQAGIKKEICFHVSRHTFATMELTLGADLYVVSKLLGHTNVGTTQIYADIVNKRREEAVDLMDSAFETQPKRAKKKASQAKKGGHKV